MNKFKALMLETRAPFLTVSIMPVIIGTGMAYSAGLGFNIVMFALSFFGWIFMHLGTNVLNDYYDDINGTDRVNKDAIFPFTGGSRMIQNGILKPKEVFWEAIACFVLSAIFLAPVMFKAGLPAVVLFIFAFISGYFYVAPPFKWAHRGLGEMLIFAGFGPVITMGSYLAQGGAIADVNVLLVSIVPGLMAAAIVDINEFPDYEADKQTGKKNLIVRLGREAGRFTYILMVLSAYITLAAVIYFGYLNFLALAGFVGLPLSLMAVSELMKNYNSPKLLAKACGITIVSHLAVTIPVAAAAFIK